MCAGRESKQWWRKKDHQFYVKFVKWLLFGFKQNWNWMKPKRKCLNTLTNFVKAFLVPQASQLSTAITSKTCQMLHSQLEATPSLSPLTRYNKIWHENVLRSIHIWIVYLLLLYVLVHPQNWSRLCWNVHKWFFCFRYTSTDWSSLVSWDDFYRFYITF